VSPFALLKSLESIVTSARAYVALPSVYVVGCVEQMVARVALLMMTSNMLSSTVSGMSFAILFPLEFNY
jgi:hypothetical protein